jgi:hypothetical protein
MTGLSMNLHVENLKPLHSALLRQAQVEAQDERVRLAWRTSEKREAAARRAENRQAWGLDYYRTLEASHKAISEDCGQRARELEEVIRADGTPA